MRVVSATKSAENANGVSVQSAVSRQCALEPQRGSVQSAVSRQCALEPQRGSSPKPRVAQRTLGTNRTRARTPTGVQHEACGTPLGSARCGRIPTQGALRGPGLRTETPLVFEGGTLGFGLKQRWCLKARRWAGNWNANGNLGSATLSDLFSKDPVPLELLSLSS